MEWEKSFRLAVILAREGHFRLLEGYDGQTFLLEAPNAFQLSVRPLKIPPGRKTFKYVRQSPLFTFVKVGRPALVEK